MGPTRFALWFPEIAAAARDKSIWKPRSEFVNIRVRVLRKLLVSNRRFAYEQTLNMLIHWWEFTAAQAGEAVGGLADLAGVWVAAAPAGRLQAQKGPAHEELDPGFGPHRRCCRCCPASRPGPVMT